jgi:hypothetical protein
VINYTVWTYSTLLTSFYRVERIPTTLSWANGKTSFPTLSSSSLQLSATLAKLSVGDFADSLMMVVRHNVIDDSCLDFEGGFRRVVLMMARKRKKMIGHRRGERWPTAWETSRTL